MNLCQREMLQAAFLKLIQGFEPTRSQFRFGKRPSSGHWAELQLHHKREENDGENASGFFGCFSILFTVPQAQAWEDGAFVLRSTAGFE